MSLISHFNSSNIVGQMEEGADLHVSEPLHIRSQNIDSISGQKLNLKCTAIRQFSLGFFLCAYIHR